MTQQAATPAGFWDRVDQAVERGVAKYVRAGLLNNASISSGAGLRIAPGSKLVIQHPTGNTMLQAGIYDVNHSFDLGDGSYQPMLLLYRADGTLAFSMYDPDPTSAGYQQFLAVWDRGGNIIVSDDTNSGQGMARPYLSGGFEPARYADFAFSTTSATFETVAHQYVSKQQPRMRVRVQASMDTSATTGEIRVLVDGVQLGSTSTESFAISTRDFGPAPIAGTHEQLVHVEIQGRITSASGSLKIQPLRWETLQS